MDYEWFKAQIFALIGVDLSLYKENQMKRRIDALIGKYNCKGYQQYVQIIKEDNVALQDFKEYITINVTEFFRNPLQWETLQKHIVPELLKSRNKIKIWSAACSTGDEPYSLAMMLGEITSLDNIEILATDIDKNVLAKARNGVYTEKSVLGIPVNLRDKYMIEKNGEYHVCDKIKKCIQFREHNLLRDSYPQGMDLIVCRNVVIYFTEEAKREVYKKFNQSLNSGGVLFVGSTEQIIMCQDYGFESNKIFFYHKTN